MKRGLSILILFIISVSFISASDVAYVLKNPARPDQGFMGVFNEMNLSVELIDDNNIKTTDFSNYDLIFVGNDRIANSKYLPVTNSNAIIANGFYGKLFGLSDRNILPKVLSNFPLNVIKDNDEIQVYTKSTFIMKGISIPYYYIPSEYKSENMQTIAKVYFSHGDREGDVISYSSNGANKCFFGITETKYWTNEAKNLFKDCVGFVLENENPPPQNDTNQTETNETMIHNVGIDREYTNSVGGIRIKNLENDSYLLENISELMCDKEYKIDFKTKNLGNFTENISFLGTFGDFNWSTSKDNLGAGNSTTAGSKTINISFSPGNYAINIFANIENDSDVSDNHAIRNVKIICEEQPPTPICGNGIVELPETCDDGNTISEDGCSNVCSIEESQNETMIHDIGIDETYSSSVDGIRIKDLENNSYLLENISELMCSKKYTISYKTINLGNFTENITFDGMIANYSWTSNKDNLEAGDYTTAGSKTINVTFVPGFYNLNVTATIEADSNLANNFRSRVVEIVC